MKNVETSRSKLFASPRCGHCQRLDAGRHLRSKHKCVTAVGPNVEANGWTAQHQTTDERICGSAAEYQGNGLHIALTITAPYLIFHEGRIRGEGNIGGGTGKSFVCILISASAMRSAELYVDQSDLPSAIVTVYMHR